VNQYPPDQHLEARHTKLHFYVAKGTNFGRVEDVLAIISARVRLRDSLQKFLILEDFALAPAELEAFNHKTRIEKAADE